MSLTNDIKKQGVQVVFKVKEIRGSEAHSEVVRYELLPANIKRIMRKDVSKIETSFICETKEGKVKIKPYLLTRNPVHNSVRTAILIKTKEYLCNELKKQSFESNLEMLVYNKIQRNLRGNLSKITPMGKCEVRIFEKIK